MGSTNEQVLNSGNQQITNYNRAKIFIGENRFQKGNYLNNTSYDPLTLLEGTLMGRIASSGVLIPCVPQSTDGSQYPVGILAHDVEADAGETVSDVTICDFGDVAEEQVIMKYGGSLDDIVASRRIRDWLQAQGIKLVAGSSLTGYDNQ